MVARKKKKELREMSRYGKIGIRSRLSMPSSVPSSKLFSAIFVSLNLMSIPIDDVRYSEEENNYFYKINEMPFITELLTQSVSITIFPNHPTCKISNKNLSLILAVN